MPESSYHSEMTIKTQLENLSSKLKPGSRSLVFLAAGLLLAGWLLNTPSGVLGKTDAVGYAVCHRIEGRSFHLGERPISFCARCTGMYVGAVMAMVYLTILGRRRTGWPGKGILGILGLFLVAFGVDGINSVYQLMFNSALLYEPNNTLRLITGTGMGLVIAAVLLPAFNQTVWRRFSERAVIEDWGQFAGLLALCLLFDLLILTETPFFLYPLTIISALGVMIMLTMIYSMALLILFRKENRISHYHDLILPLSGGFIMAMTQIILLDLGRFLLTGTWDGFHLFLG